MSRVICKLKLIKAKLKLLNSSVGDVSLPASEAKSELDRCHIILLNNNVVGDLIDRENILLKRKALDLELIRHFVIGSVPLNSRDNLVRLVTLEKTRNSLFTITNNKTPDSDRACSSCSWRNQSTRIFFFEAELAFFRMVKTGLVDWLKVLVCVVMFVMLRAEGYDVPITFVESAVAQGAVCLDGSPPAYHFDKGFGGGINNWLIHVEGGAWCNNASTCLAKRNTRLGSSKYMDTQYTFSGILSKLQKFNPDFYNWNRVKVRYCDGSSFTGDVEAVNPATKLYFRGSRVWRAIIDDLLAKGMKNAQNAILAGCSAGGLTAILHCDSFSALLPGAKVKCLSDAGFFINAKDLTGAPLIEELYAQVVDLHQSAKNLPASCTSQFKPEMCFFPQNAARGMQTPLFLLNAAYDSWQIKNTLAPGVADPHGTWHDCKNDIKKCSSSQLQTLQGFRTEFLGALSSLGSSSSRGSFINSCYAHCQSGTQETWLRGDSPVLDGTNIATAIGDWYYGRSSFQKIDCAYPCDKTCHNRVFE
ncbi:hypothetical protein Nepgr_011466 [Nepenthes gracilis]|uniref:Pectin acetylesterase n=1 Tax=Nepenthes gracilis TaxID=150966 RepID=A0AAD3SF83_NEPGR|nr:hypothetical protein Nepgr_011466 [Nepenthes gracilis]